MRKKLASRFGAVLECRMLPGQVMVRLETHDAAELAVAELGSEKWAVAPVYNTTAYSREHVTEPGQPYSGWWKAAAPSSM